MIASTSGNGLNIFRPNFHPVLDKSSSEENEMIEEIPHEEEEQEGKKEENEIPK